MYVRWYYDNVLLVFLCFVLYIPCTCFNWVSFLLPTGTFIKHFLGVTFRVHPFENSITIGARRWARQKSISTIFGLNVCVCDSGFEVMFVLLPHPTICSILCIDPLTWSSAHSRPWPAGVWPSTHQRPWPAGFWPSAPSHDLDLLVFVWPSALPRPWSAGVRSREHSRPWPVDVWSSVLP